MKELIEIQKLLKAPKNQRNNFGNYNYRSCEDILEAVKPLCADRECFLLVTDEVVNVGESNYVKATALLTNVDGLAYACSGWAREAVTRKGMDDSQITGSASSYARKYALNGLFCIDDTKDADSTENAPQAKPAPSKPKSPVMVSKEQIKAIMTLVNKIYPGISDDERLTKLNAWLTNAYPGHGAISSTTKLTKAEATKFIDVLSKQVADIESVEPMLNK